MATESIAVNIDATDDPDSQIVEDEDNPPHTNYEGNTNLTIPIIDAPYKFYQSTINTLMSQTQSKTPKSN